MSSIEAMWTVRFESPDGAEMELRGGVAVFESGRLFGGDSGYAYLGGYEVKGDTVSGSLTVLRHDPTIISVFGDVDRIEGFFNATRTSDDHMSGTFLSAGFPAASVELRRFAELP